MANTLFDCLGGKAAVDAAVTIFYEKVLADESIRDFFVSTDMQIQRQKLSNFLTMAFGGPVNYSGKSLTVAHSRLVHQGLDHGHFDAVAVHLKSTLQQLEVAEELITQVQAIVENVRVHVLGLA